MSSAGRNGLRIFATSPQSKDVARERYLGDVVDVARWSEAAGCEGILVYTDNGLVDPWLVAQLVLQSTEALTPLVAVQPAYMHPYSAAKMVASLGHLHCRRLYLNIVAGGFRNDLIALDDPTPHDERYERAVEYTTIVMALLSGPDPVTVEGRYYTVRNLRMTPPLPAELRPGLMISGSSPAGLAAARALGALAVRYPKPPEDEDDPATVDGLETGCRVGIIARGSADEAWRVAHARFPEDRKGQLTHQLAMKVSDSSWHQQLARRREQDPGAEKSPYWLGPFQNYKTFCPYLVGSYEAVGDVLIRYVERGFRTFILDIPPSSEELNHTALAFAHARSAALP